MFTCPHKIAILSPIMSQESLFHKVFHKRAEHPVIYGMFDLAVSGGALLPPTADTAHAMLTYSSILQSREGVYLTTLPTIPELHHGLAIDSLVTASLYFVYYFGGFRPLNPVSWFKTTHKGVRALRNSR